MRSPSRRSLLGGAAALVVAGSLITTAALSGQQKIIEPERTSSSQVSALPTPALTASAPAPAPQLNTPSIAPSLNALPGAEPVGLRIPAIGVNSGMMQLDLLADGSVAVPPLDDPKSTPGWYRRSPAPGEKGPAIILGHVDSKQYGPGTFFKLGQLKPGDRIEVPRSDGSVAAFAVESVERYAKNDFPTLQVYGNLDYPGLRLITCGGSFNVAAHSYEDNTVVYARLI